MDAVADRVIHAGEGTLEADWLAWPGFAGLPEITLDELLPIGRRAVIVAPHPDDEVLAVGGLLALAARHARNARVIAVSDGGASHPGSSSWPRGRLLRERPCESLEALRRLGATGFDAPSNRTLATGTRVPGFRSQPIERLGFDDGTLAKHRAQISARLQAILEPGDVLFTTWRFDGHPDHEACGLAVADAADRSGARAIEVPVWAWHWATPGDRRLPWHRAHRLMLDSPAVRCKCDALQSFRSQLSPDPSTGHGAVLRGSTVMRCARPFEVYFL